MNLRELGEARRTVTVSPTKALRRGLRGHVPLRRGEHFIANHEFADRRRPKQRRIKVSVHVPLGVRQLGS
jgi:hypothetical protein